MKITVIGSGAIGGNLATRLSNAGHDVAVADARGREAVNEDVLASGARAVEMDVATQDRDVIILAIPFSVQKDLAEVIAGVPLSTVVVDTSNYYPAMAGPVDAVDAGKVESVWSQETLGRPIVKAWNAALAATQQTKGQPSGAPGRIAIPVAADSSDDRTIVMQLVDDTGFDPYDAGVIAESWRQQPGTPAYCTELGYDDLGKALAAAVKDDAPAIRDQLMAEFGSRTEMPPLDETVAVNRAAFE